MHAYIFAMNLAVLVNIFSSQEISIFIGFKASHLRAHFILLLVAKGRSGFFIRAIELDIFYGFMVCS